MPKRVAINGFGRIGRAVAKVLLSKGSKYQIVAINDLGNWDNLAYLMKYDSAYGRYDKPVEMVGKNLKIGNKLIPVLSDPNPAKLPWKRLKVDVVLECTGAFTKKEEAGKHLKAGAKSDIIGTAASAIVDLKFTKVVDGNLVKILAWYDNEWGYSNRLAEMVDEV